jgi:hypothetical protein
LLLKVFETRKPAFEAVFFLTQEIVDDHKDSVNINKIALPSCQGTICYPSLRAWRYSGTRVVGRPD